MGGGRGCRRVSDEEVMVRGEESHNTSVGRSAGGVSSVPIGACKMCELGRVVSEG